MKLRTKKGFTLVEVLIVVVIIGILAALIIPRLIAQPNKARIAEAKQMLGAIRRAQITYSDSLTASFLALSAGSANWATLGLQEPTGGVFTYTCTGTPPTTCMAAGNAPLTSSDTVTQNLSSGGFTCAGALASSGTNCIV